MRRIDQLTSQLTETRKNLERDFGEKINMNAYLSHPKHFGFNIHYDTHDVIIAQIKGEKEWQLYGTTFAYPLSSHPSIKLEKPRKVLNRLTLGKGDILYIPRGMWHSAKPTDSSSFHLTIGIHCTKLIDVILDKLTKVPELRRNLRSNKMFCEGIKNDLNIKEIALMLNELEEEKNYPDCYLDTESHNEIDFLAIDLSFDQQTGN